MDTLDAPVNLKFNNGKLFPSNVVFVGYVFLGVGVFSLLTAAWPIGLFFILLGAFLSLTFELVIFDPEKRIVKEQTNYLGFIPSNKIHSCNKWKYMTVIPVRRTTTIYASAANYTTDTRYVFTLTLLNEMYRNKKELVRFDDKGDAELNCERLCERMSMEFFKYDPMVIREFYKKR